MVGVKRIVFALVFLLIFIQLANLFIIIVFTGRAVGYGTLTVVPSGNLTLSCGNLTTAHGRWNYVSSPVHPANTQIKQAFYSIEGSYDWAFEYNHSEGNWEYYFATFDMGPLQNIYGTNCYVIKAVENDSLEFTGPTEVSDIEKNLTTDYGRWNYVGWVNEDTALEDALKSIEGEYDWVFRYNSSSGNWDFYYAPFDNGPLRTFHPCECYVIKAKDEVRFNYTKQ